jgi:hypothetical protein
MSQRRRKLVQGWASRYFKVTPFAGGFCSPQFEAYSELGIHFAEGLFARELQCGTLALIRDGLSALTKNLLPGSRPRLSRPHCARVAIHILV